MTMKTIALAAAISAAMLATAPAIAQAPSVAVTGTYGDWTVRESTNICSIGAWKGATGQMLLGTKGQPGLYRIVLFYADGTIAVTSGAAGTLKVKGAKEASGVFQTGTGAKQDTTLFRTEIPSDSVKANSAGDRLFDYQLSASSPVDKGNFAVGREGWNAWRACLGG